MKFASLINFTEQGIQNVAESHERAVAFSEQAQKSGLNITELLWLTGRYDGLIVFTATDAETASAAMLQLSQAGNVKTETLVAFDSNAMKQVVGKL